MKKLAASLCLLVAVCVPLVACTADENFITSADSIDSGGYSSADVSSPSKDESFYSTDSFDETSDMTSDDSDDTVQTYVSGDFEYALTNDVARLVKYSGDDTELVLPSELDGYSLTAVEAGAFAGNSVLQTLEIGNSVVNVASGALSGCTALEKLSIGSSVAVFDPFDLDESVALEGIDVANTNGVFASVDGVLYNGDKTVLLFCPRGLKSEKLTLPQGLLTVGERAFAECAGITSAVVPSGCELSAFSFFHCTSLQSVTLPQGLTAIPDRCFFGCVALKSVAVPAGVTTVGELAFFGCVALAKVSLPSTVTSIGDDVFKCCSALKSISVSGEYATTWYYETGKNYIN